MPIFPTPIDLDADYDWGGLHKFEFIATFEGGIKTEAITSSGNLVTTLASGGQGQYLFGANPIYLMSATEFRPAEALTAVTLGSPTREWTNVYGIDGDFSGTVTANVLLSGKLENAAGYSFIRVSGGTTSPIKLWRNTAPQGTNSFDMGSSTERFRTVYSVDGNFTGNLLVGVSASTSGAYDSEIHNRLLFQTLSSRAFTAKHTNGTDVFNINTSQSVVTAYGDLVVGGNLDTEVGGSNRLFNLGSDADVAAGDTEYLNTFADSNVFKIRPERTGSGSGRELQLQTHLGNTYSNISFDKFGLLRLRYSNTNHILIGSGYTQLGTNIYPTTDNAVSCGRAANRWSNVHSVDGDFSGDVIMAANVDFTGLPTSDPLVAGRLWNHNDTMKISAG